MKNFIKCLIVSLVICAITFLLFVASYSLAQSVDEEQTKIKNLVLNMYNSSVSIFSIGKTGNAVCSGVVLKNESNNTQILTAKHCSDVFEEVYVEDIRVSYTIESATDDLAILILKEKLSNKVPIKFASNNAKRNDIIYHVGFPEIDLYTSVGVVFLNTIDNSYAKMTIVPGCSGGGLFDENGDLIGIAFAHISFSNGLTVYESIKDVKYFIDTISLYLR